MVKVPHGLALQRIDHHQRANREQDHHDADDRDVGDESAQPADFFPRHSVSDLPSRRTENSRITKSCTQPPNTAPARIQSVPGKIAELRCEHRPDQRPGPGDGGEVMSEDDPFVGGHKVAAVFQPLGRSGARGIQRQNSALQ